MVRRRSWRSAISAPPFSANVADPSALQSLSIALGNLVTAFEALLSSPAIKRITKIGYIERQFPREIIPPAPCARQPCCDLHRMAASRK